MIYILDDNCLESFQLTHILSYRFLFVFNN